MKTGALPLVLAVALGLAACGSAPTEDGSLAQNSAASSASTPASGSASGAASGRAAVIDAAPKQTAAAPPVDGPVAQKYGLAGKSVVEIVNSLDQTNAHRGSGLNGSVRADELVLTDETSGEKQIEPVPDDLFYMSVAPYLKQTHDCFNHSLTGCQGENPNAQMQVKVAKDDGTVLYEGLATTFENGFVGFWLPRDIQGTMSISYDGRTAQAPFSTDAQSPTCLTTVRLA